ncbi:glutathione-independent formaldehyde dehydrogenase [Dacryopinax primogenitus]|uniref:Glutathione-independent formaldehyde dehydrogenase n=1 Tax=Dacryopinax primogenitus (strain DJM 731) TaxID=1858805 RepID=M5FST5_DACPD|nr:glutathione-independent formaldehyde dehydrogenase [Dacryopinax primogenitus]EJU00566.1 glutathione-independent formaldehyde dehydrogenase [Dacryopinax primogenitus]
MSMKAIVYKSPFSVAVEFMPKPKIEHTNDAIIRGRTPADPGLRFGHENMGIVEEVGKGVAILKKGDRIVLPFNVSCGHCKNCERSLTAFCLTVNPGFAGGAYGFASMGPYAGGQAQYLRVPCADFNALVLPPGKAWEEDFILLADVFSTGWHGITLSSVAVWGAGPVGLMAAYSAILRGASSVFVVDRVPERLQRAQKIGCLPVDFTHSDPVEQITKRNGGMVDRGVDAVGYQAVASNGKEQPNAVLSALLQVVRPTGGIGIPGLYLPADPGAKDEETKNGNLTVPFGKLFEKGLSLGTGQANVKAYNRELRDLIVAGRAKPSFIVTRRIGIDDVPEAYEKFDKRADAKVLIHPNGWST